MPRPTFRRRKVISNPLGPGEDEVRWPTELYVRPDRVGIYQDRPPYVFNQLVMLDADAMEYLISLWQEVRGSDR